MSARLPRGTRLSAMVVNYNTGAFSESCVRSLQADWRRSGLPEDDLEVVVIDNASPEDQSAALEAIEALGARVVRNPTNDGYSGGVNRALAVTTGGPSDVVAILNPDLHFTPGSVEELMAYVVEHPDCGVVDPLTCVDPDLVLHLPRNMLPTPTQHLCLALARMSRLACAAYNRWRVRQTIPWWTSEGPIDGPMLSGCCMFLRREVVAELPALLDERYPLYFEDTDLFRVLGGMGYRTTHLASARVLHHWSRSLGLGRELMGEGGRRHAISQRAYFEKHHGRLGALVVASLDRIVSIWPTFLRDRPLHRAQGLGEFDGPVEVPMGRDARFVIELALQPTFTLTAGIVAEGERWVCPERTWEWFLPGRYWIRAVDRESHEMFGCWTFIKTSPGRDHPIGVEEAEELWGVAATGVGEGVA